MYPPQAPTAGADPLAAGAPPDQAPAETPQNPLITLEITDEQVGKWFKEIEAAQQRRSKLETIWDVLLDEYMPTVTKSGQAENVKSNSHFRNTHSKIPNLFFQNPDLHLEALGPVMDPVAISPLTGQPITAEDAITIKKEVLKKKLGRDGVNAPRLMDKIIFDAVQWSGIAAIKVGYRNVTKIIQEPVMQPDPAWVPPQPAMGSVLGLGATPQPPMVPVMTVDPETGEPKPMMQDKTVVIWESWDADRLSAKKILIPGDLTSNEIDKDSCWIGHEFFCTGPEAKRWFNYAPANPKNTSDDRVVKYKHDEVKTGNDKLHGYELFIRAAEYDDTQPHPLAIYHLVLFEGERNASAVAVYRPSPDQTFDELGQLTPDSLEGYPIEVLNIRDQPDSPYTLADAAFTNSQIKHIDTHRRQSVELRDAAISRMGYDESHFTPDEVANFKQGKIGKWVALRPGALAGGADKIIAELAKPTASRDDYRLSAMLKQDMEETIGIGGPQAGVVEDERRSATENDIADKRSGRRMGKDQSRVIDFYLRWVRKFDTLLIRYATTDDYVQIAGQGNARRLEVWNNRIIGGKYAYDFKPDSQMMIDAARDRAQLLKFLEVTAPFAVVDHTVIIKKAAGLFGMDPGKVVIDPLLAQMGVGVTAPAAAGALSEGENEPPKGGGSPDRKHEATGGKPNAPTLGNRPNEARP